MIKRHKSGNKTFLINIFLGFHKILREIIDEEIPTFDQAEILFKHLNSRYQAIRALANMDVDDRNYHKYDDGVFLVHPTYRTEKEKDFKYKNFQQV